MVFIIMDVNSDSKKVEDRKYVQLSKDSVRIFAEAAGHTDVTEQALSVLTEDLNYRLRETAQNCGQIMRHAKRKRLTCDDVNLAFHWSTIPPVHGHSGSSSSNFVYVKEAEIFCVDDKEVDFTTLLGNTPTIEVPGEPFVEAAWLVVEGSSQQSSALSSVQSPSSITTVSQSYMQYYDQVTKAILGNDSQLLQLALDDLLSSARLGPVLPYLVNFVSTGVKKMNHDLVQLSKLLYTIRSLVNNPSLYLGMKPYLSLIVNSVLYCILEPLAASINPINDHWTLRDSAAQLLAWIVKEWSNPVNCVKEFVLKSLQDSFKDFSKPFCSHYGAVVGLVAFGIETVEETLYPYLSGYWPHLVKALADCNPSMAQIKMDAQKVYGALLLVSELLIRFRHKELLKTICSSSDSSTSEPDNLLHHSTFAMYSELYNYFGDALSARLPYIHVEHCFYKPKETPQVQLFSVTETLTGEEILESFNEKEEDLRSPSAEDDNSYDGRDDNSEMSDEHELPVPIDMQVKSTISDPSIGIKLTIALRRPQPVKEEAKSKKKKLFIKPPREVKEPEPVFDLVPLCPVAQYIEFSFEGASPLPPYQLRRRTLPQVTWGSSDANFLVSQLNLRLKKTGKIRRLKPKEAFQRRFISGNLEIIL